MFADKHSAGDRDKRLFVIAEAMTKDEEKMKGTMVTAAVRKIEDLSVEMIRTGRNREEMSIIFEVKICASSNFLQCNRATLWLNVL